MKKVRRVKVTVSKDGHARAAWNLDLRELTEVTLREYLERNLLGYDVIAFEKVGVC